MRERASEQKVQGPKKPQPRSLETVAVISTHGVPEALGSRVSQPEGDSSPSAWCVGVTWAWGEHQTQAPEWHPQEVCTVMDSCSEGSQVRDIMGRRRVRGV